MKTWSFTALLAWVFGSTTLTFAEVPNAATRAFLQAHPGTTTMVENDRVVAIHGATFASDSDANTTTDQFVSAFLAANGPALGIAPLDLVLKDKVSIRFGQGMVYTYTQHIETLPVYASVVKISVSLGTTEKIGYVGIRLVPPPANPLPADVLTAQQAIAALQSNVAGAGLTAFSHSDKVVFETEATTLHRAWMIYGSSSDQSRLFMVDTNNGAVIADFNLRLDGNISGRVTGHRTPCCTSHNPANPSSCPDESVGMYGIEVITDPPSASATFADEDGNYELIGLPDNTLVNVRPRLVGQWVTVDNCDGSHYLNCQGEELVSVPSQVQVLTSTQPVTNVNFLYNPTPVNCSTWPLESSTVQVNVFDGVQRTHDWFRLRGGNGRIDKNLRAQVDSGPPECNAYYLFATPERSELLDFPDPYSPYCTSFGFNTVISHEYGHFILDQRTLADPSLHEGFADAVSALMWDTPFFGDDAYRQGLPLRDLDNPNIRFNDCSSINENPLCNNCVVQHCKGLAFAGAFWDLRSDIGNQAAAELLAAFVELTDGRWSESIILQVLAADDDNGNLLDGTPNMIDIVNSFADWHGWPNPLCLAGSAVKVAWDGPPPNVVPEEGVDYEVQDIMCPPIVTLKTTEKGGFAVRRYFVGRTEADGSAGDIGRIITSWATPSDQDIIVEVGTRPTEPCRNLNEIDALPQDSEHWSSIRLNLLGGSNSKISCYAATSGQFAGHGGRISGSVAGNVKAISAKGIGDGADVPASLNIGGALEGAIVVGRIPSGSTLEAHGATASGFIGVSEEMAGTLHIHGDSSRITLVSQTGAVTGDVIIEGDLRGTVSQVYGDMVGDFYVNGQFGIVGGLLFRNVLHGDLCAANVVHDQPLPLNVGITCGIGTTGKICGQKPVCLPGNIVSSSAKPPHGTRDGRQPYPVGNHGDPVPLSERQGIGSPNPDARQEDKIFMTLSNPGLRAISHDCWELCETGTEPVDTGTPALSENKITCISEISNPTSLEGDYQIKLERPISAKQWTTIQYVPGTQKIAYASLPGNINGDNYVNSTDILWRADCMSGNIPSHCGSSVYTQDLNHSGVFDMGTDYGLTWTQLWNGEGRFIPWQGKMLPPNTCQSSGGGGGGGGTICPVAPCGPDPGPQMAMSGGGGGIESQAMSLGMDSEVGEENSGEELLVEEYVEDEPTLAEQNAVFADWVVNFVMTADPQTAEAQDILDDSMSMVTQWCVDFFTAEEKSALAARLSDSGLVFASQAGQIAASELAQVLAP